MPKREAANPLRDFLTRQDKDRLVDLLVNQAMSDERLFRSLSVEMAKTAGRGVDLAAFRRSLRDAFEVDYDFSYRDVYRYAEELDEMVDSLADLLKEGHAVEVIELTEHALELGERALEQVDDSGGDVSGVLERLQELHLAACRKARPDPEALARRLFAWELRTSWDTFYGAVDAYSGVLGKKGLAQYRRLAEAEWDTIPALKPGQREEKYSSKRFRLTKIMERLAGLSKNLEALVAVKARDLSTAYDFLEIAQLYKEARQMDRALEWAEKGVSAFPKQTDPRLRLFLADLYHARKRHDEAMALVWANFVDRQWVEDYSALKDHAGRVKGWAQWREKALGLLREQAQKERRSSLGAPSRLVEILLWDKDTDAAWTAAQELGCSEHLWLELARCREGSHPEEALPIYQRQVESALRQVNDAGYREAVKRLQHIRKLMKERGWAQEFAAYLESVRQAHQRKRNFMRMLAGAKLG